MIWIFTAIGFSLGMIKAYPLYLWIPGGIMVWGIDVKTLTRTTWSMAVWLTPPFFVWNFVHIFCIGIIYTVTTFSRIFFVCFPLWVGYHILTYFSFEYLCYLLWYALFLWWPTCNSHIYEVHLLFFLPRMSTDIQYFDALLWCHSTIVILVVSILLTD